MGNKQDNISLIAGDNIVINVNNSSWTIEGDTTIMKTQTLNTSTINSSTMNSSSLSVVNLITCNDLNVGSEITTHTASIRTINSSYCNSLNASFDDLNASSSNISNITIATLTGQNTNSVNMNASIFNSDDITCEDFTLDTNGIMKIKSNSVRGQLSSTNNKFNISCSTSQYISLANGNSEICNIHSDKFNINVSTNISGALNASYYMPITAGSVSSDNMKVEEFFVNDTGIITFSAGTGGSGGGSIKTLPNEGLNISCGNQLNKGIFLTKGTDKKIEITELVKINVSTNISGLITTNTILSDTIDSANINASTINVSSFTIANTNFTNLNASNCNASNISTDLINFQRLEFKKDGAMKMEITDTFLRLRQDQGTNQIGACIKGYDDNHAIYLRRGLQANVDRMDFHETGDIQFFTSGSLANQTLKMRIRGSSTRMDFFANVYNTGNFYVNGSKLTSDDRLKHNEEDISGLSILRQLKPQKYIKTEKPIRDDDGNILTDYVNDDISGNIEVGLIAQELLETDISFVVIKPEEDNSGEEYSADFQPYYVDYNIVFTYAIQAIKELDEKMNNLEAENSLLLSRVAELENS